jgi:5-hydroxyisourate hydrolase-like protein (transthyretin family)
MHITVTVIDGVHGQPAEGIEVSIVSRHNGLQVDETKGHTDGRGQLEYSDRHPSPASGVTYHVEIDIDSYFATLGIVSWHKKVATLFRVLDPEDAYQIVSLITPFTQVMSCVR